MASVWGQIPHVGLAEHVRDFQIANRYADRIGMLAIDGLGDSGVIRQIDSRLATLAITENSAAYNEQRRAIAHGLAERFDLVEIWDAQLDQATCQECWGMDGEMALVGQGFASGLAPGNVHPRCRCTSHFERRIYQ